MSAEYKDQTRVCEDCGRDYLWSADDQAYFHEKVIANPHKRCKDCRKAKKERSGGGSERQKGGWR